VLHDVEETEEADAVEQWFATSHQGEILIGPLPLVTHQVFYPEVPDAFLAWAPARCEG
jgi:hypothetical protein